MSVCTKTIDNFLDYVVAQGTSNVTTLLLSCSANGTDVCANAWGVGNPDISGIGAIFAYVAQVGITCIICPLYALIFAYYGKESNPHRFHYATNIVAGHSQTHKDKETEESEHDRQKRRKFTRLKWLSENLDTFTDLSCQFSLMVSVASIVRINQGPTFFEKIFLQALVIVQLLGVLAVCVSNILGPDKNLPQYLLLKLKKKDKGKTRQTDSPTEDEAESIGGLTDYLNHQNLRNDHHHRHHEEYHMHLHNQYFSSHPSKSSQRLLRLLFYCMTILALFWVFVSRFDVSQARLTAIHDVLTFCSKTHPELNSRWNWYTDSDAWPTWFSTLIHISGVDEFLVVFIFGTVYGVCVLCIYVLTPAGVALALCGPMIFFLVELLKQRHYMSKATGAGFQDNNWGFGQILALLMWAPFVVWLLALWLWIFITWCWDKTMHRKKNPKSGSTNRANDIGDYELHRRLTDAEEGRTDITSTIADDETEVNAAQNINHHPHHYVNLSDQDGVQSSVRRSTTIRARPRLNKSLNQSPEISSNVQPNEETSSSYQLSPVSPISGLDINMSEHQASGSHPTQVDSDGGVANV